MELAFRQLVLYPSDPDWSVTSTAALSASLQRIGMLGPAVVEDLPDRFLIGEAFLQLFSFMGCAPSIEFAPRQGLEINWQEFVFLQLSPPLPSSRWLVDELNAKPGCPHCQRRSREWRHQLQPDTQQLLCPHCGHSATVCDWRWYDAGGCARQFVSVVNVYPKESIPTDSLLSQLQEETAVAWQFFYWHGPLLSE